MGSEIDQAPSPAQYAGWQTATDKGKDPGNLFLREVDVLGGGFVDGLQKTLQTTAKDLSKAGSDFIHHPLDTTANYIHDHWHEAVAGAVITALSPKKWANVALLAFSLRGLATNTLRAGIMAADSDNDSSSVRNFYSNAIAHEGTAFVSSLPATLAGGYAGRIGANAVFGKNMGVSDLIAGRVKSADVKANLWEIHDALNPPKVKLVISDMDNTLSNFSKYEAMGVKEAISNMESDLRDLGHPMSQTELYRIIGNEMDKARSHDYPWSVELALSERLKVGQPGGISAADFHSKVSKPFWETIDKSLVENLHLFEDVTSTLSTLKQKGIPVVVLSDAPAFIGLKRLTEMNLDQGLVERMWALDNAHEPHSLSPELLKVGQERVARMLAIPHQLKEFRMIPKEWEKPNPNGFQGLMSEYNVRPKEVLMIGDSRVKDLGVAQNAGARAIWAKFGNPEPQYEEVLTRLRPLPENAGAAGQAKPKIYPAMLEAADSYAAVLKYLEPRTDFGQLAQQFGQSLRTVPRWQSVALYNPLPKLDDLRPFTSADLQLLAEHK